MSDFSDRVRDVFNKGKLTRQEMVAINKLYNSGKKIDAQSQLNSYIKRRGRVS